MTGTSTVVVSRVFSYAKVVFTFFLDGLHRRLLMLSVARSAQTGKAKSLESTESTGVKWTVAVDAQRSSSLPATMEYARPLWGFGPQGATAVPRDVSGTRASLPVAQVPFAKTACGGFCCAQGFGLLG